MKPKVLILTVSRKVSLIKSFKDAGWHVTGQDLNPNAIALSFCDAVAVDGQENGPFDMILPTRDADLRLGTHRVSGEVIDICTDKLKFSEVMMGVHSFSAPFTFSTSKTSKRGVNGPEFIKPRFSSADNKEGGEVECVHQELLSGEEYSVDGFSDFNSNVISLVPRRRLKVISGESCVTSTVENKELLLQSEKVARSLRLIGHYVMQCFKVGQNYIWTDINLRYGGASRVAIEAGCASPKWYKMLISGEEVKPCIGQYKVGLTGYSYSEWSFGVQK